MPSDKQMWWLVNLGAGQVDRVTTYDRESDARGMLTRERAERGSTGITIVGPASTILEAIAQDPEAFGLRPADTDGGPGEKLSVRACGNCGVVTNARRTLRCDCSAFEYDPDEIYTATFLQASKWEATPDA